MMMKMKTTFVTRTVFFALALTFHILAIVFSIIDSFNFCFPRAMGGIFFPHIKDTKFLTTYQSICYKVFNILRLSLQ